MVEICFKIKGGAQARGRVSQGERCWKEVGLIRFCLCSCIHLKCSLVMFSFFFFMCIEAHVSMGVCVRRSQRLTSGVFPGLFCTSFVEMGSLSELEAHWFGR